MQCRQSPLQNLATRFRFLLVGWLVLSFPIPAGAAPSGPTEVVRNFYGVLCRSPRTEGPLRKTGASRARHV